MYQLERRGIMFTRCRSVSGVNRATRTYGLGYVGWDSDA